MSYGRGSMLDEAEKFFFECLVVFELDGAACGLDVSARVRIYKSLRRFFEEFCDADVSVVASCTNFEEVFFLFYNNNCIVEVFECADGAEDAATDVAGMYFEEEEVVFFLVIVGECVCVFL